MTIIKLALLAAAAVGAVVAFPGIAAADSDTFQSPSGNIFCAMDVRADGTGSVVCQGDGHYAVPRPAECHLAWGDRFSLDQGGEPVAHCHGDTIVPSYSGPGKNPNVPTLDYGRTRSAGAITCDSEPTGMTCTDAGTGHYLHLSRESNDIG
ncbi:DUF6636 domain-containing protein [Nocardia sp. alder85J]|uniref:DUF6636 domain-containing protein n=1 Tax=Nocardia sp. alder85J TaxID=2862949 RepID=UPI001CD52C14|nr:DUF6636 domain-containing protein [Nocardia sp. alder85J]MCX4094742.1 hypothetical protein [Nocardia sp. alder85J]